MSTNLQSKRTVIPQPGANLDAKTVNHPETASKMSNATAPNSELGESKVTEVSKETVKGSQDQNPEEVSIPEKESPDEEQPEKESPADEQPEADNASKKRSIEQISKEEGEPDQADECFKRLKVQEQPVKEAAEAVVPEAVEKEEDKKVFEVSQKGKDEQNLQGTSVDQVEK